MVLNLTPPIRAFDDPLPDLKLCSRLLFYLKSFHVPKFCFKFLEFEIYFVDFQKVFWMEK